jgi:hypothetical protein
MKMVVRTGLVPVRLLAANLPYSVGQIVGLLPEQARRAILAKEAEEVEPREGVEVIDLGPVDIPPAPPAPEPVAEEVEIPDDWHSLHHLQRIVLAKKISGADSLKAAEADEIIEAEVKRRKGDDDAL